MFVLICVIHVNDPKPFHCQLNYYSSVSLTGSRSAAFQNVYAKWVYIWPSKIIYDRGKGEMSCKKNWRKEILHSKNALELFCFVRVWRGKKQSRVWYCSFLVSQEFSEDGKKSKSQTSEGQVKICGTVEYKIIFKKDNYQFSCVEHYSCT